MILNKKTNQYLLLLIPVILMMGSCGFVEEEGDIPAFVYIKEAGIQTNNAIEGASTADIRDVWMFVDGQNIGIYEIPSDIPVLPSGSEQSIRILPGIRNNGIQSNPVFYPFYEIPDYIRQYNSFDRDTLSLEFKYKEETIFKYQEDFEGINSFTKDIDGDENTSMVITSDEAVTGGRSGKLMVQNGATTLEVASNLDLPDLPTNGSAVYLEIDYKGNTELLVGVSGTIGGLNAQFYKIILKEQDDWTKVYIDLAGEISGSQLETYNVLLGVMKENESEEDGVVYVDNIKLVHF